LAYNALTMIQVELDNAKLREATQSGQLVEILDPSSGKKFVLIPSEQYERMCTVISADLDPREFRTVRNAVGVRQVVGSLLVVLVLFGGAKLPKLARSLGQAQSEFKRGLSTEEAKGETKDDDKPAAS
jgi:sec-independent protein translocase protein TatA